MVRMAQFLNLNRSVNGTTESAPRYEIPNAGVPWWRRWWPWHRADRCGGPTEPERKLKGLVVDRGGAQILH